jgi:YYY domain-containing protein
MAREVLTYWAVAQLFGLVGLPLARVFFRPLPDRGYAFAKTLGLLLTGYLAWLLAMLGLAPFGAPLLVVCALVVLGAGLLLPRTRAGRGGTQVSGPPASDASLGIRAGAFPYQLRPITWQLAWLRDSWRLVLGYELLFALALLFLALLRSYEFGSVGPNPWGTERPMDYALFNAIRQSESFPPHDPWMSGYPINYYYFGYLLMAAVALVSGLSPAVSYNLSLALVFALAALGAAGMVYNLIELTLRGRRPKAGEQLLGGAEESPGEPPSPTDRAPRSAAGRWLAMALAVVLVLFAGNQGGALQLITGTDMAVALRGGDLARAVANGLGPRQTIALAEPFRGEYFDGTSEITPRDVAQDFNWWNSSRAVWDDFRVPNEEAGVYETYRRYAITEFPFFSFWLGDMHPHVMALPFGLLALALALSTLARPDVPRFGQGREGWILLVISGVVLGSLYVINSWDLPTYLILFVAALAVRYGRRTADERGPGAESEATDEGDVDRSPAFPWRELGTQAGVVLLAAFALFLPFHLTFRSLVGGKEPLIDLPLLSTLTRTVGFVTWGRTELHSFLIVFGLFLLPLLAYIAAQLGRGGAAGLPLPRWWPLAVLGALALGLAFGFPLLFLLPLGILAASAAFERVGEPATAFTLGAFALGCAICFGVELIYIRDVFESRLNTVFKFYYQTWLIWGVLAAYAAWWLAFGRGAMDARPHGRGRVGLSLVLGLFAVLLVGALVYPWHTAGRAFSEGRAAGLAGVTPRERSEEGAASIAWLRQNAPGDAVILEAVGPAYDIDGLGFGGVSSATGLATVMGWEGHQGQWRGGQPEVLAEIGPRAADVATIYSTPDAGVARELLAKYGVDYIYVGGAERVTYPPEGIAKLEQLGNPVFQQGEVTIYQVAR